MPPRQDIAALIDRAQAALTNAASDPDLQAVLAPYGYDPETIEEGTALIEALSQAQADQIREYGEQHDATRTAEAAFRAARTLYLHHLQLARIVFDGDVKVRGALRLAGKRSQSRAGLLSQARKFYLNALANESIIDRLATVNTDREALEAGQSGVRTAEAARAVQLQEIGQAQQSTVVRDEAEKALRQWFSRFTRIATLATNGHPQLRERLGLLERS